MVIGAYKPFEKLKRKKKEKPLELIANEWFQIVISIFAMGWFENHYFQHEQSGKMEITG